MPTNMRCLGDRPSALCPAISSQPITSLRDIARFFCSVDDRWAKVKELCMQEKFQVHWQRVCRTCCALGDICPDRVSLPRPNLRSAKRSTWRPQTHVLKFKKPKLEFHSRSSCTRQLHNTTCSKSKLSARSLRASRLMQRRRRARARRCFGGFRALYGEYIEIVSRSP